MLRSVFRPILFGSMLCASLISTSFAEVVVDGAFFPNQGEERRARFSGQVDVGDCSILDGASVTIRRDGTVTWDSLVASTSGGDAYCTRLIFVDRNGQRLFVFPFFCSQTLTDIFSPWVRHNLAIPEHIFPFVRKVARNDKC